MIWRPSGKLRRQTRWFQLVDNSLALFRSLSELLEDLLLIKVVPLFHDLTVGNSKASVSAHAKAFSAGCESVTLSGVFASRNPMDGKAVPFSVDLFNRHYRVRRCSTPFPGVADRFIQADGFVAVMNDAVWGIDLVDRLKISFVYHVIKHALDDSPVLPVLVFFVLLLPPVSSPAAGNCAAQEHHDTSHS